MDHTGYVHQMNPQYIDELYHQYLSNPDSVDPSWQRFFEGFELARTNYVSSEIDDEEIKVLQLIDDYRSRGHLFAKTNPVRERRRFSPELGPAQMGLDSEKSSKLFDAASTLGMGKSRLKDIVAFLEETYLRHIGVEYMYIRFPEVRDWLQKRMESARNRPSFSLETRKKLMEKVTEAVYFEKFLQNRFPGQKRFSVEGSESIIPALDFAIEKAVGNGVESIVIGMSHRGRLNVLTNILHKPADELFTEFAGKIFDDKHLLGDVKYHLGYTSNYSDAKGNKIEISLAPNPSHLETVGPVVAGLARAKIEQDFANNQDKVLPIIIHGDAAIAGQGIVYELLQMAELEAYNVGGTIHVVLNNQVGFTTDFWDARSGIYCTDVAKILHTPIFHVNGDDIEAVAYVFDLAIDFRQKFNKDVFIDIVSYRKYGHNEGDEPRFTQPDLYSKIDKHKNIREIYLSQLMNEAVITRDEANSMTDLFNSSLEKSILLAISKTQAHISPFQEKYWRNIRRVDISEAFVKTDTTLPEEQIRKFIRQINKVPDDFRPYRKIDKIFQERIQMLENGLLDWGMAEQLAYASLVNEGFAVRISGQDVERGTFSHRHAVIKSAESNIEFIPLQHINENQATFNIYNSLLSEYAVLGFEYGYALRSPQSLVIWEAQFGDFSNGAQIMIDQYISAAEEKWNVSNGLTLFLPHGYEGQGPEHSSARMERYLQLAANYNMEIANVTTPANLFHLLRRQMMRNYRKPLVLFTPKSLLRLPACKSSLDEFSSGAFETVINDKVIDKSSIRRVIICSGKIYYDLVSVREEKQHTDTAIIRVEQLYPLDTKCLQNFVSQYPHAEDIVWVQDEPGNMGAWTYFARRSELGKVRLVCRPDSASPATGSTELHKSQQQKIVDKAFGDCTCEHRMEECHMLCSAKEFSYLDKINPVGNTK